MKTELNTKKIVILGAGFAGLTTALNLEKQAKKNSLNLEIILVDKNPYQVFNSNLYEVAASEEELTSIAQVKKTVTVPVAEAIEGKNITFIQDSLVRIHTEQKILELSRQKLNFDYLVLAMGSVSDYFGIEGAEEFSISLKTLQDGFRIRNAVEFVVQKHRQDLKKKNINIVIAGGGYTGVELAGELALVLNKIAWKNEYPRERIKIKIVEACPELIAGLSKRLSQDSFNRLQELGVEVLLQSAITKVDKDFIYFLTGEKISYDTLVWSVGIKARSFETTQEFALDKKGRLLVNEFLQTKNFANIFCTGDMVSILKADGRPVPSTAQDAIHQAKYLAKTIVSFLNNSLPEKYAPPAHGFIVSIGGKWAILSIGKIYFKGFFAHFVSKLAHLRYFISILGLVKALKYTLREIKYFSRND